MLPIFTNLCTKLRMLSQTAQTNPFRNLWGVAILVFAILVFSIVSAGCAPLIGKLFYGLSEKECQSLLRHPEHTAIGINFLRWTNLLQFLTYMAIPAVLITLISHYRFNEIGNYTQAIQSQKIIGTVCFAMGMIPLMALITSVSKYIPLGDFAAKFNQLDTQRQTMFETLLTMKTYQELAVCLFILACLPAFLEEYIFRGLLFNLAGNSFFKQRTAIFFQATVFAALHFSPFEFIGIFAMGVLFGIISTKTGTLWYASIAHFVFNASTIIGQFYILRYQESTGKNFSVDAFLSRPELYLSAIPLAFGGIYLLLRTKNHGIY